MAQCHPLLMAHLSFLKVKAMHIAFSWCYTGFTQLLPPEQILQLWDLLIGNLQ